VLKNLRARLQVFLVHRQNHCRVREIQLIEATIDEHSARVKHGAHGAIGKDRAVGEDVGKLGHSILMLSH
jgi:hypothetical protein